MYKAITLVFFLCGRAQWSLGCNDCTEHMYVCTYNTVWLIKFVKQYINNVKNNPMHKTKADYIIFLECIMCIIMHISIKRKDDVVSKGENYNISKMGTKVFKTTLLYNSPALRKFCLLSSVLLLFCSHLSLPPLCLNVLYLVYTISFSIN